MPLIGPLCQIIDRKNALTNLNKQVIAAARQSIEVDDFRTKSRRHPSIHLPAGVRQTLTNGRVLRREAIATGQC